MSPRNLKCSEFLATGCKKNFHPPPKKYLWVERGLYTMENKDANTDYQKVVRVGNQKSEIVEITIGIIFFCFQVGSFQVLPEKNHPHLKCQFPPKIPI